MIYIYKLKVEQALKSAALGVCCYGIALTTGAIAFFVMNKLEFPPAYSKNLPILSDQASKLEKISAKLSLYAKKAALATSIATVAVFGALAFLSAIGGTSLVFYAIVGPLIV